MVNYLVNYSINKAKKNIPNDLKIVDKIILY